MSCQRVVMIHSTCNPCSIQYMERYLKFSKSKAIYLIFFSNHATHFQNIQNCKDCKETTLPHAHVKDDRTNFRLQSPFSKCLSLWLGERYEASVWMCVSVCVWSVGVPLHGLWANWKPRSVGLENECCWGWLRAEDRKQEHSGSFFCPLAGSLWWSP